MITRRTLLQGALGMLPGPSFAAPEDQADIYVATTGNDAGSARADAPVVSLQRAKELVAELRRRQPQRDSPVVVAIRGGLYHLDQPIRLGPEDSGTEASPTIYQAFGDERPVLSGGVRVDGWEVADDGSWRTTLDGVRAGRWSFAQLFVDGQRRYRPRLPAQGYFRIARPLGRGAFGFAGDEIHADWANLDDVEVLAFHDWSASRMRIRSVAVDERSVVFTGACWKAPARDHRYLVDNVREALRAPGQWYLDRARGELIYLPKPGERPDRSEVIAPRLEQVLVLQGDSVGRRWVQHIHFRGLTFAHTNWSLPATGQDFPQAEIGLDAAVTAIGARDVVFERCTVRHTGGYGMAFGAGSRHNRLEGCDLIDLGAGGIKIGHAGAASWDAVGRLPNDPEMHVSHHVVRNCRIARPAASGRCRRLDRPVVAQQRHAQRRRRLLPDRDFDRLDLGLWSQRRP